MYRSVEDFLKDWKCESDATLKLFKHLTATSLRQKVTPDGRSLGYLAWHIVLTLGEMGRMNGLSVQCPPEESPEPSEVTDIAATYEVATKSIADDIRARWTNDSFRETIEMYGEKWSRGEALTALVKHQIHHRAQMTVLMRQAGLKVPGIYGPSREEWSQLGMSPQN